LVTVEELTPAGPGWKPRRIVLRGPSLPLAPAGWGSENAVITNWNPGNGVEATQQDMGPRELPSSWNGVWRRTMLGRMPAYFFDETGTQNPIISPLLLVEAFERLSREGQRLRVTWQTSGETLVGSAATGVVRQEDSRIVREGKIKTFKPSVERHTDVAWEVEFHWASRGQASDKVVSVREDVDLTGAATAVDNSVRAMEIAIVTKIVQLDASRRRSASTFSLGQLEAIATVPLKIIQGALRQLQVQLSNFKRATELARTLQRSPFAVTQSVLALARGSMAIANTASDTLSRTPPELMTTKLTAVSVIRAANYFGRAQIAAQQVARQSWNLDSKTRRVLVSGANRGALSVRDSATTRQGDILAIFVPRLGDTPLTASQKFYGTPDHGVDILRANRLPWYTPTLRPGVPIIIPALTNASTSRNV
jgi:hypothetical protein